jgi:replicative DNA helicase
MLDHGACPEHLTAAAAERSLLACVLRDADAALDEVLRVLDGAADFYHAAHGLLFGTCLHMQAARTPVTVATVYQELLRRGQAAELGPRPAAWLAELLELAPTAAEAHYWATRVREAALRRRMLHIARTFVRDGEGTPTGDPAEMLGRWEAALREAADAAGSKDGNLLPLSETLPRTLEAIDARAADPRQAGGVPTGFAQLDELLGGLRPGQLVVVGARPGIGKTAFAAAALSHAVRNDLPAFLASLEMSRDELSERLLTMLSGVRLSRIRKGTVRADEVDRLYQAAAPGVNGNRLLLIDDTPAVSVARFAAQLRRAIRRHGCRLAALDYLQLMAVPLSRGNRTQDVSELSRGLKLAARECGVPVLALAQLNRQTESRGDGRPRLSDLRESGSIEADADVVILLHVPPGQDMSRETWEVEAIVEKSRSGPKGSVVLSYHRPTTRFGDAA